MNQIIIFEGPDGVGKTEIGKALAKQRDLSYFKNHSEHHNFTNKKFADTAFVEASYLISLLQQVKFSENGIILDRHMPSEWVYSQVFNRQTDREAIWKYDQQFSMLGAVIVYCFKDYYKEYDDEIIDHHHIEQIKELYEEYFQQTEMPVLHLNTTDHNLGNQLDEINEFLDGLK